MSKQKDNSQRPFMPLRPLGEKHPLSFLTPYPQEITIGRGMVDLTKRMVSCSCDVGSEKIVETLCEDLQKITRVRIVRTPNSQGRSIRLTVEDLGLKPEGYTLATSQRGVEITGQDSVGLAHGVQTFLQLAGFGKGLLPSLKIRDWPLYRIRSVMLDMGRGIYRRSLIERCIRIMARLKLNMLHLHLYDDQLMGVRFETCLWERKILGLFLFRI
ncbi:MAG: glycoside hydrolase family 20 zincin-like fold domain-containing protein [Phycisphaerae bacterium]